MLCAQSYYDRVDYRCDTDPDYKHPDVRAIEKVLDNTREFVEGLTEELTGKHPIDLNAVSFYLEEIRSYLDLKDNHDPLTIYRS